MGFKWKFQRVGGGGGVKPKSLLWEGYGYFLEQHNILGLGAQATITNFTAELETDAKRFLTSVNGNACREI